MVSLTREMAKFIAQRTWSAFMGSGLADTFSWRSGIDATGAGGTKMDGGVGRDCDVCVTSSAISMDVASGAIRSDSSDNSAIVANLIMKFKKYIYYYIIFTILYKVCLIALHIQKNYNTQVEVRHLALLFEYSWRLLPGKKKKGKVVSRTKIKVTKIPHTYTAKANMKRKENKKEREKKKQHGTRQHGGALHIRRANEQGSAITQWATQRAGKPLSVMGKR